MTMTLTRDEILGKISLLVETIDIPEWGGKVHVREMSGAERDAWEALAFGDDKKGNLRATLAVACLCDETGKRLFVDEDAGSLGATSAVALQRIFDAAMRINKLRKDDYEDAAKN
jgi:hypothetical protein